MRVLSWAVGEPSIFGLLIESWGAMDWLDPPDLEGDSRDEPASSRARLSAGSDRVAHSTGEGQLG